MNRDRFGRTWKQLGGRLKEHWRTLTSDLRCEAAGRNARRAGAIQEQYGISKEEAARQLKAFSRYKSQLASIESVIETLLQGVRQHLPLAKRAAVDDSPSVLSAVTILRIAQTVSTTII
jgi:uncharacterized protein YjbJ (UPF0337 family)